MFVETLLPLKWQTQNRRFSFMSTTAQSLCENIRAENGSDHCSLQLAIHGWPEAIMKFVRNVSRPGKYSIAALLGAV
jgi:hypothetical protein